jgi:hypothetical protein
MNKMLAIALVILCMGAAASVQGEMISGPFTTTTPIPYTLTDWVGSLSFPQFDSSLGTLLEVDLYLRGDMNTVLTVHNTSTSSSSSGWAKTELQMSVQDTGGNLNVPELDALSPQYNYSLAAGDTVTSGTLSKFATSTDQYFTAAVLSEFTGPGTIALPASTLTQTVLSYTGGNTEASQVTQAKLTGTVTYHYEAIPTPEPSTLALLAAGVVGLLGYFSRRRAA